MGLHKKIRFSKVKNCELLPSAAEMQALDKATIESGVPSLDLMEKAGEEVSSFIQSLDSSMLANITILCGNGNNGGDGLVVARLLSDLCPVNCIIVGAAKYSEDFLVNFSKLPHSIKKFCLHESSLEIEELSKEALAKLIGQSSLIVDAILGSGQSGAPKLPVSLMVEAASTADLPIISIDIPTGVNADTGCVYEPHIKAKWTISIELIKRGLVQEPAKSVCGFNHAKSIGINLSAKNESKILYRALTKYTVPKLPKRSSNSHKNSNGRVLVVGGSYEMPGALQLCLEAIVTSGAGRVSALMLDSIANLNYPPETIRIHAEGTCFEEKHVEAISNIHESFDFLVLGPGIGRATETKGFIEALFKANKDFRVLVDADGLNLLSELDLWPLKQAIVTPHLGEAARLLSCSIADLVEDPYKAAESLRALTGATIVLKGPGTIVLGEESAFVNTSGNPYLAQAGSGDVLSGLISSYAAQGLCNFDAAALGVFIHGYSADLLAKECDAPFRAGLINSMVRKAFSKINS